MPKAVVHHTKFGCVNYNDIKVIARIEEACDTVRSRKLPHLAAASLQFGINYGTLHNWYHKLSKPTKQAHENKCLMNDEEEAVLVDWIKFLGMVGRLITRVVFKGSVQSGFLPRKCATMDRNRSRTNPDIKGTELNHRTGLFQSIILYSKSSMTETELHLLKTWAKFNVATMQNDENLILNRF
ncbi:uncharacterized protein LACBIDRAFT_331786 [Laccaria bicolor S238N-H82]|uniref:Predicted protein n=1 Tax=Laccaria bicolor (strain S238N-H82 / ATCC MYA-4686) TaxID=486041 RepID=B0DQJ9_LACBS|nr:uncharacterized protein LACBIDRAFT_331786 [Laccaria bicolor S238N-H82]EDR03046.1 predicted protein [Laccaria bicolor S238N-H82]|eukprot:XP_001886187.1 predicted protein [Laccaria bicolor S238N-H82]